MNQHLDFAVSLPSTQDYCRTGNERIMNSSRLSAVATLLTLCLLLSACAVGPDYLRPQAASAPQWYAALPHQGDNGTLAQWWSQFDDPLLAELIAQAQEDNPGLNQALARIAQSRAEAAVARAALFPEFTAKASGLRLGGERIDAQKLAAGSLDAAWEIDLFGGNRRAREAAQARYEGTQAQWHDARVSLAAEVAQDYVALRSCEALVKSYAEDLDSRRESERLTQLKVAVGFEAPADGALATATTADGATRLNAQQAECEITVKTLVALTGLTEPELRARLAGRSGILPSPSQFRIAQLPAQTLMQRPDLAAAERELAAASAQIGVAQAARYPSLTLSGSIGHQSLRSGATTVDGQLWSFGPAALSLPIFDAGRRAAGVDSAQGRYDEALASYLGRSRQAVREVEQALVRLDSAGTREGDARRAAENYEKVFKASDDRWRVGAGSLLDLEIARRLAVVSRTQLLNVQRERLAAWISLYRAAGGGWSPSDPIPDARS
jgi:multidrug efflux system outer membrane protein